MAFDAYEPHLKVKPQVLADAAVEALTDQLNISQTVTHGADYTSFDGSANQTITKRVKGTLPIREYAVGNDRTEEIVTDEYSEQTVNVTVARTRPYSAVRLTDEQKDWDFGGGWGDLILTQTEGMAQYLENGVLNQIEKAPYELVKLLDASAAAKTSAKNVGENAIYNFFVQLQLAMRKMRNPDAQFTAQVGSSIAELLMTNAALDKEAGTGVNALSTATIGKLANITFELNMSIPHDVGYIYGKSAVVVHSSTATVPNSVPFGATASANGWAVRWLMDYETGRLTDRSVIDCFSGYQYTKDHLTVRDQQGIAHVGDQDYFVRGVKFGLKGGTLGSTEKTPGDGKTDTPGGNAESWLAKVYTGQKITNPIDSGKAWSGFTPAAPVAEPTP